MISVLKQKSFFRMASILLLVLSLTSCDVLFDVSKEYTRRGILNHLKDQYVMGLVQMNDGKVETGEIGTPVVHPFYSDIRKMKQLNALSVGLAPTDSYASNLDYMESYKDTIEFDGFQFTIYAYHFNEPESSIRYFEAVTNTARWFANRFYSWEVKPICYISYDGEYAMRIEGERWETIAYLMTSFDDIFDIVFPTKRELMIEMTESNDVKKAVEQYARDEGYIP